MKTAAQTVRGDGKASGTDGENGKPTTSIEKIKELDTALIEVTKHLPITIGSVFKVDSLSYPNWGFAATRDNAADIKQEVDFYYRKDYAERRRSSGVEYLLKTDFKVAQEKRMTEFIAVMVREILRSMDDGKREFHICDIPARDGYLSAAIAHALRRDSDMEEILSRTVFHLVDISGQKLDKAEETLGQFRARSEKCITEDELLFRQLDPATFDIVVTLGHLHHKPFLVNYLKELNRVLSKDGALVIADWHSPLCSHPAYILALLQTLGLEPYRLDMLRGIVDKQLAIPPKQLEQDEKDSLGNHMTHWKSIMRRLLDNPPSIMPRLYINAAYDTSRQREKKLAKADFTVDLADVRKAFPRARLPLFSGSASNIAAKRLVAGSDSATVMAAVKKR